MASGQPCGFSIRTQNSVRRFGMEDVGLGAISLSPKQSVPESVYRGICLHPRDLSEHRIRRLIGQLTQLGEPMVTKYSLAHEILTQLKLTNLHIGIVFFFKSRVFGQL